MLVPCVIEVDLGRSPTGGPSMLERELGGKPLLWWTVSKANMMQGVGKIYVTAKHEQVDRVKELVGSLPCEVLPRTLAGSAAGGQYIRNRKWALGSWKGGSRGATVFSEEGHPDNLLAAARRENAGYVIKLPAAGPLVDVDFCAGVFEDDGESMPVVLTNAPPGLGVEKYSTTALEKMSEYSLVVDSLLALDIDRPVRDPAAMGLVFLTPQEVAFTRARFLGDTERGWSLLKAFHERWGEKWLDKSSIDIVRQYASDTDMRRWDYPREIEFEVTTASGCKSPVRTAIGERARIDMDVDTFRRALDGLADADDVCITLGGYGDPLLHPDLKGLLDSADKAGVFGMHIHTDGTALDDKMIELLAGSNVDVVSVALDADAEETYGQIKGRRGLEEVSAAIESLIKATIAKGFPVVLPEFTKQIENSGELDGFFEKWFKKTGNALIRTQDDLAGRITGELPLALLLGKRVPCEHLMERMFVLADGTVPVCIQDVDCTRTLGNVKDKGLGEMWTGEEMRTLVDSHFEKIYDTFPLCARCKRWCVS